MIESINKQLEKQVNIIIDRYLKLNVSIKDIKKYLTGKNIKVLIDELSDLETTYLKRNKDDNEKDFKLLVKDLVINVLKDRSYAHLDKNEGMKYLSLFENFKEEWDEEENPNMDIVKILSDGYSIKVYRNDWNRFVDASKNKIKWGSKQLSYDSYDDCLENVKVEIRYELGLLNDEGEVNYDIDIDLNEFIIKDYIYIFSHENEHVEIIYGNNLVAYDFDEQESSKINLHHSDKIKKYIEFE